MPRVDRLEFWRKQLDAERGWMRERGTSLAGYLDFYTPFGRTPDNIEAIFKADLGALRRAEAQVGALTPRRTTL